MKLASQRKGEEFDPKSLALPAKLDIRQVIAPEYLIKHLSFVDGGQRQTFIDALLVYEAARRSVMEDIVIIQGLASAQAQITDTQIKLLREAKSDSKEVARIAAEEAAWRVGQQVQEVARQTAKPESPNPMASMLTNAIQPYFSQAIGQMFGMFGGFGAPGGMMPQPAGQPGQTPPSGGQPLGTQPGSKQISNEEMEAAFNDG